MGTLFLLLLTFISVVSSQSLRITAPYGEDVYNAGEDCIIAWTDVIGVSSIDNITLRYYGNLANVEEVLSIAENVDPAASNYIWTIPIDTTPDYENYDIVMHLNGGSAKAESVGFFTIQAPGSNGTSSSSPSSPSTQIPTSSDISSPGGANSESPSQQDEDNEGQNGGVSAGVIAGAVVGGVAGLAIIIAVVLFFFYRKRRQAKKAVQSLSSTDDFNDAERKHTVGSLPLSHTGQKPNAQNLEHQDPASNVLSNTEKPDALLAVDDPNYNAPRLKMAPVKPDGGA
ncbi:hypothetical protein BJV82DRAFT_637517 [Fennellomyces sp. T-0311]|nr:hypothetical protein BJV82DRAFT_637517 [Fennellomyces sp. T-0311]